MVKDELIKGDDDLSGLNVSNKAGSAKIPDVCNANPNKSDMDYKIVILERGQL